MSNEAEKTDKVIADSPQLAYQRRSNSAEAIEPMGYVAMHEINAAMCLAGGVLMPRFEGGAAIDHHMTAGHLHIDPLAPTASSLSAAKGDLPYGAAVLFEVPMSSTGGNLIGSLALKDVRRLLFESEEQCDLFRARMSGYGDVPSEIVPIFIDKTLFQMRDGSGPDTASFLSNLSPVIDESFRPSMVGAKGVYVCPRTIDRCAGGFLAATSTLREVPASTRLIRGMASSKLEQPGVSPLHQFACAFALLADQSPDAGIFLPVLSAVISVISSGRMDDGFSASQLLREAKALACEESRKTGVSPPEAVEKFWDFTNDVLAMRREMPAYAWSDEGGASTARGILAFMLNPEPEQLQAMRDRTPNLGAAVHFIAGMLVGLRSGLTRMGKDVKSSQSAFLAGASFVNDWLLGKNASLTSSCIWDQEDGSQKLALTYDGLTISTIHELPNEFFTSIAAAVRTTGMQAYFSPSTGVLFGILGDGRPDARIDVTERSLVAFPRLPGIEVGLIVTARLTRRLAESLSASVNNGAEEHGVYATVVEEPVGLNAIRLSVLVLKDGPPESLQDALTALTSKARQIIPLTPSRRRRPES